ncbi:nicotinate-nucleotide--dimethylbenzimidazole phosphoribosyltransferase [uncultured Veillonella sp.]|uniref:nicotinate-nucleotide--dimethylbenzimidazole phosphoribosyltransferase n=1 Tax=Veillonella atypica TaxID=39777 RepID=UPI0026773014|nr:nicotinate-nucleotide--dimethylbenzimidazole phosphoribosyltransferase [uncultured Veillonella sp.]MDU7146298.1 nicotinate-nucleotide--dimethylbenzimidazole phosphoribosyltransferase [Veillonella sp.]
MGLLQETCDAIHSRSKEIEQHIIKNWNDASDSKQYGRLVNMVAQYGAATNQKNVTIPKPCMIIASADHGVADMGVSAYPKETTVGMTQNYLIPKGAGANSLANYCGATMEVIDMGIDADMSWVPGLRSHKLGMGTKNFVEEPAMTREQAIEGIETGIRLVQEKMADGYNVFLVGEMGISNTTASALMTAKFAGLTAEEATGRGTNISDERLKLKQRIVHDVLVKYQDIPKDDAIGILATVGGFEFTCIVGVILGAAAHHGMVIIDGFNTSACALVAKTLVPASMDYVMASHLSAEKAAKSSLQNLGLEAYVDLGLCLGEASGGSVQMGMLDLAVHMYKSVTGGKA